MWMVRDGEGRGEDREGHANAEGRTRVTRDELGS